MKRPLGVKAGSCGLSLSGNEHPSHVYLLPSGQSWCAGWPIEAWDSEEVQRERDLPDIPDRFLSIRDEVFSAFAEAYVEYGESSKDVTGLAGQWADLYRKIMKLKAPLWEGDTDRLTRESADEILRDLIGHAYLALDMMGRGIDGGRK